MQLSGKPGAFRQHRLIAYFDGRGRTPVSRPGEEVGEECTEQRNGHDAQGEEPAGLVPGGLDGERQRGAARARRPRFIPGSDLEVIAPRTQVIVVDEVWRRALDPRRVRP